MRIVCEVRFCYDVEGGEVIDDHGDEFEYVDGDERSVFVVWFEEKCLTLDLLGEVDMPLEA